MLEQGGIHTVVPEASQISIFRIPFTVWYTNMSQLSDQTPSPTFGFGTYNMGTAVSADLETDRVASTQCTICNHMGQK